MAACFEIAPRDGPMMMAPSDQMGDEIEPWRKRHNYPTVVAEAADRALKCRRMAL